MSRPTVIQVSCVQMHWGRSLERNLERTLHFIDLAAQEADDHPAVQRLGIPRPAALRVGAMTRIARKIGKELRAGRRQRALGRSAAQSGGGGAS